MRVCVRLALRRRFLGGLVPHAVLTPAAALYLPAPQSVQSAAPANEYVPASQLMQTEEPVVRAQRQTTSQIHMYMYMYICIEDVCVCVYVPILMYVC